MYSGATTHEETPSTGKRCLPALPWTPAEAQDLSSTTKSGPSSPLWSAFHPDSLLFMAASRNDVGQGSPTFKNNAFIYFLGISIRALGTRVLGRLSRPSRAGCNHILLQSLPSAVTHKIDTGTSPWHLTPVLPFLFRLTPALTDTAPALPSSFHLSALFMVPLFVLRDRVSLSSPGCPGSHSVDEAGFQLTRLPAWVLGLKAYATTAWSVGLSFRVLSVTRLLLIDPQIRTLDQGGSLSL